eukprot:scaffold345_cov68-Phaeocystis_antarctica.AAC.5
MTTSVPYACAARRAASTAPGGGCSVCACVSALAGGLSECSAASARAIAASSIEGTSLGSSPRSPRSPRSIRTPPPPLRDCGRLRDCGDIASDAPTAQPYGDSV